MFPLANFDAIPIEQANELLTQWGHRMGPLQRANVSRQQSHALFAHGRPVALACTSSLVRECVGGGLRHLTRANTVELSRLCASNAWANRVVLRLWRELVFPGTGATVAISYQDAAMHTGNTYRLDGWARCGFSSSGTDARTGRKGRRKWIWVYPRPAAAAPEVSP